MKSKLFNILFKLSGIALLLIFGLTLANTIIYRYSVPDKYQNSNWVGKWESSNFSLIGGKIIANLPAEIPTNEEFEVDAMIYYDIWSIYKMGGIKEFKLIGMLGGDNSGGGQNKVKENRELKTSPSLNFKAKIFGLGGQEIDYSGIANKGKTMIVGGYKSSSPRDIGNFEIKIKL